MSKISGQFLISGQFQDICEISGKLGAHHSRHQSLSSPITACTFHSRLKTHLVSEILSSIVTLIPSGLTSLFVLVSGYVC